MKCKSLGGTGIKVSSLGFGALQFSRLPHPEAINLVRAAYGAGINFFDTAHLYPHSEDILGKAIKGIRGKLIISSKSTASDKKIFLEEFDQTLKKLDTDYIDIFMCHDTSDFNKFDRLVQNGVIETLIKEKQKGKVKHIGFSCHTPEVIEKFYEINDFEVIMIPINFVSTEFTSDEVYGKLMDNNIGIFGMKPLGGGRIDAVELSLKYIKRYKQVIPVIGMEKLEELEQNISYMESTQPLTPKDWENIRGIKSKLGDRFCRDCGYCLPCPQGIDIPKINFIKVYYDQFPFGEFKNAERSEAVKKVDDCIECGECEEKCPYSLNIIEMIRENRDFYLDKIRPR